MKSSQVKDRERERLQRESFFLRVCLFLTGACALVLEIFGTRLISPYYGSSLYCWSALITVTLVALAAGYHWGGRLADRTPVLTLAARLLSAAAVFVALTPLLRAPILRDAAPLGVQLGALASAAALVAPALVLLSALGPLAVRLLSDSVGVVGRSTGTIYGLSTLGSVAGAALAGFVLVPHVPLSQVLYGMAVLLLLLATWAQSLSRRDIPLAEPALAVAVALFGFWPRPTPDTNIVLDQESAYGQIKVLDFNDRRYLLVNGTDQSMALLPSLRSDSQYAQAMELAAAVRPKAKRALLIGLGAGLMAGSLQRDFGLTVDAVEIDPAMAAAAKTYFGYRPNGDLIIDDGRRFLERTDRRYDLIFLDAFSGEAPPFQLFTKESFEAMSRRLQPGGLLAINFVAAVHGDEGKSWRSAALTLRSVFPAVAAYQGSDANEDLANIVFFCGDGNLPTALPAAVPAEIRKNAALALSRPLDAAGGSAELLTDDFAPMESLLADSSVRWRRILQDKVSQILLY